jgi:hypothetical protein
MLGGGPNYRETQLQILVDSHIAEAGNLFPRQVNGLFGFR